MASKFFAVVAGVGAGTGRSVAIRFAQAYPVVLLARNPDNFKDIVAEIKDKGGQAIGISTDVSSSSSVTSAFETIKKEFPDKQLAAAICKPQHSHLLLLFTHIRVLTPHNHQTTWAQALESSPSSSSNNPSSTRPYQSMRTILPFALFPPSPLALKLLNPPLPLPPHNKQTS